MYVGGFEEEPPKKQMVSSTPWSLEQLTFCVHCEKVLEKMAQVAMHGGILSDAKPESPKSIFKLLELFILRPFELLLPGQTFCSIFQKLKNEIDKMSPNNCFEISTTR